MLKKLGLRGCSEVFLKHTGCNVKSSSKSFCIRVCIVLVLSRIECKNWNWKRKKVSQAAGVWVYWEFVGKWPDQTGHQQEMRLDKESTKPHFGGSWKPHWDEACYNCIVISRQRDWMEGGWWEVNRVNRGPRSFGEKTTLLEGEKRWLVCIFSHCYLTELGSTGSIHSKANLLTLGCGEGNTVFTAGTKQRKQAASAQKIRTPLWPSRKGF